LATIKKVFSPHHGIKSIPLWNRPGRNPPLDGSRKISAYRADQILQWIYKKPSPHSTKLKYPRRFKNCAAENIFRFFVGFFESYKSDNGESEKFLFKTRDVVCWKVF